MHRARLAEEARAERLEHAVALQQRSPEALRLRGVVGGVGLILGERDGIGNLDRHRPDVHVDAEALRAFPKLRVS